MCSYVLRIKSLPLALVTRLKGSELSIHKQSDTIMDWRYFLVVLLCLSALLSFQTDANAQEDPVISLYAKARIGLSEYLGDRTVTANYV